MAKKKKNKCKPLSTAEIQYLLQDLHAKERFSPLELERDWDGNIVYNPRKVTPQVETQRRVFRTEL